MSFEEKVKSTAESIIELYHEEKENETPVERIFPMNLYRIVEINGVKYGMMTTVEMNRI